MSKITNKILKRPEHGGRLIHTIKKYMPDASFAEKENWLDLSTGINPNGWPVPVIPARIYNRLPENDDGLIEAAQAYYQTENILPVSGSQAAIQLLPIIFQQYELLPENAQIGIISPCYAEHEFQWQANNFSVIHLTTDAVDDMIAKLDVLLIINPNNPTGESIDRSIINKWQLRLNEKNAYLIVDEAFMDSTPKNSIIEKKLMENTIILRSVGKFFGLAGVRCGFVIAPKKMLSLLAYHQGPWSVSGPARWLVRKALSDKIWIDNNMNALKNASIRLENLLKLYFLNDSAKALISGTYLYKTVYTNNASALFEKLAMNGILVRLLDKCCPCLSCESQYNMANFQHKGLRFGLPANERQWQKLESVLGIIN